MSKRRNDTSWEQTRWIIRRWKSNNPTRLYSKRVLTAVNSAVKLIGRVTLLVQLQPRISEAEQKILITTEKGIECLLGIDILETKKMCNDFFRRVLIQSI